ncbi:terminase small subunit [Salinicoccus roseus]|uniref:Terminase n=1 Tax=Salinicoccus roseus TaxID=45670 RepID=A0A0C2H8A2_9STAP|nr:terminase small subunit [Salinicoccus roseus]KIH70060.1 terminase [Salinicoccus roseus]MDB0581370.1 terminase small subunit [Salinicoccus roseus]
MSNWDDIRKEWETSKVTLAVLAEKHDVKLGTLKSRKSREKWTRGAPEKDATKPRKVATKNKKDEAVAVSGDLTDKQRLFCIHYIKYFNATKAYQKAYECSYTAAMVEGHKHLRNPKISAEIDRLKAEQTSELKMDVRDVLQKYIDIAFADITDFATFGKKEVEIMGPFGPLTDDEGDPLMKEVNYVDFKESAVIDGTILTEVKQGKDGVSVKLADKMKALEMLSKYFNLLSDKDQKRFQSEKVKAETAYTREKTKLLKGQEKDTSLMEALIKGREQYESRD